MVHFAGLVTQLGERSIGLREFHADRAARRIGIDELFVYAFLRLRIPEDWPLEAQV